MAAGAGLAPAISYPAASSSVRLAAEPVSVLSGGGGRCVEGGGEARAGFLTLFTSQPAASREQRNGSANNKQEMSWEMRG